MSRRARLALTATALMCALTTACASTAQTSSSQAIGGPDGVADGGDAVTDVPGAGEDIAIDGSGGVTQPGAIGSGSAGSGAAAPGGGARGGTVSTGAGQRPTAATQGRGFTATKVYIGVNSWQDVGMIGVMLGGQGLAFGDQQAMAKAMIADVNRRGGLAGREIVPVFYDVETERFDPARDSAAACARWTQDQPVFAVVYMSAAGLSDDDVAMCLAKVGVPMIDMSYPPLSSWFARFPLVWSPMSATTHRYMPMVVRRAKARGYFGAWDTSLGRPGNAPVRVGIQTGTGDSAPEFVRLVTQLVKAAGYPVVATAEIDGAGDSAGANSAVLKFKTEGVTHVIQDSQCIGGTVPFHSTAESQNYRMRIMLHTGICPQLLQRFVPKRQYAGAIGAGMQQTIDTDAAHDPGHPSPARPRCQQVMRDGGQDPNYSRDAELFMYFYCDSFEFLLTAIERGGQLSTQAFQTGAQTIRGMSPSSTYVMSFPSRRDGASVVRDLIFDAGCECTLISGGNHPF